MLATLSFQRAIPGGQLGEGAAIAVAIQAVREILTPRSGQELWTDWWLAVFGAHVPHPRPSDLIFNPPTDVLPEDWSPSRIVDEALAYRPFVL